MTTATHTLSVKKAYKTYYQKAVALNKVSMNIKSHEIIGLLGPNGAGKTTLFESIIGLSSLDDGDILLNKKSIARFPMHQRARIGISYLPQESSIFQSMTVRENLLAALECQLAIPSHKYHDRIDELLGQFNLTHLQHQQGRTLSGGEKRRTEIARCLAIEPKFILLDEPFAGIDPIAIQNTKELIEKIVQYPIGVIITDHNVEDTLAICHKAYLLVDGKVACSGTPDELRNSKLARSLYFGEHFK